MNKFVNKMKSKAKNTLTMKKQRGMSLLEVIIVLGIIGTMAAVVVILAQRAFSNKDITDLNDNTNSVRVATTAAYDSAGAYPLTSKTALGLTPESIKTTSGVDAPMVATLVNLGQISTNEIKNGISGDYFTMQGVKLDANAKGNPKGFALAVNGLNQTECRSFLLQAGNQWDFVSVTTAAGGSDPTFPTTLSEAVVVADKGVMPATGVMRSLVAGGQIDITATSVASACVDSADNAVILGSK